MAEFKSCLANSMDKDEESQSQLKNKQIILVATVHLYADRRVDETPGQSKEHTSRQWPEDGS